MSSDSRVNIKFKPAEVKVENIAHGNTLNGVDLAGLRVAKKLVKHLNMIKDYKDRLEAIDYLIDGAKEKAGNPEFSTEDKTIKEAIQNMTGIKNQNTVDFELFSRCIDIILTAYEEQALVSVTGVLNA